MVSIDEIETVPEPADAGRKAEDRLALDRLFELIHRLKPLDRQLMLLYLEGLDTMSIAEITGLSASNVRTKIHRIKNVLAKRFHKGGEIDG